MIRRLLIANRGEIAVRVAHTCRRLGIETVAVYSDADRRAPHVEAADSAHRIGPPEAARSYLDATAILAAAAASSADAVHPGYGFLAENAAFADRCARAGLTFVGPRSEAILAMGSKENARRLATDLGVPIVPGYHQRSQDDATLAREARRLGFPLLVKASAGGGGKGIRVVPDAAALADALATVRREAASAFGDSTLVLERHLERARHVEVQVLGDRFGRIVALSDRDCSVQRRHQKLLEEAPAPRLAPAVHEGLRTAALRIAEAIAYDSAGTVEFLVDADSGEFFFLEMNTRLQVEHPTTELVTGLDLVELQLRIAAGEPLPDGIGRIEVRGSAIEARLCAERPEQGFLPATGRILRFTVPSLEGVRVDSGVVAGSVVGAWYDSLLAKVVAHGRDREEARCRLAAALRGTVIAGVETNLDHLRSVLEGEAFRDATMTTRLVETEFATLRPTAPSEDEVIDRAAVAVAWLLALEESRRDAPQPWNALGGWRITRRAGAVGGTVIQLDGEGGRYSVRVDGSRGSYRVDPGERSLRLEAWWASDGELRLDVGDVVHRRAVTIDGQTVWIAGGARTCRYEVVSRDRLASERDAIATGDARNLVAPFPGLVTDVAVAEGERVEPGQPLVVMEAMKMVHTLRAGAAAGVRAVHCRAGATVGAGHLLVEFEAAGRND